MAVLNGFFTHNDQYDPRSILDSMHDASCTNSSAISTPEHIACLKTDRGGIKLVTPDWRTAETSYFKDEQTAASLVIHGELIKGRASALLRELQSQGPKCLSRDSIDGIFCGALQEPARNKLHIFSDFFGLEPLYYVCDEQFFAFSSTIKGLLAIPGINKQVSRSTLSSFWQFGYALLDQTPFEKIKLLPAASTLCVDLASWSFNLSPYAELTTLFQLDSNANINEVNDAFLQSVNHRSSDYQDIQLGLSLSGGLDSRAILGALKERANGLRTYTLGLPGCADEKLADKMSSLCGTRHEFIPIEESALKDFESLADMMVSLSDGLYHPHESTERVALNYLIQKPFNVMLRGHGGEIAKVALAYPFQADEAIKHKSEDNILKLLFEKTSLSGHDIDFSKVLSKNTYEQTRNEAWLTFTQAALPAMDAKLSNADLCVYLYIDQWIRRQVVASLSLFKTQVGVRLPYMDRNFITSLLKLPSEQRWSGELHRQMIQTLSPQLMSVPDSNTGAPLSAGPLRLLLTDKVNAVLRRLGVSGFRHYTEFQEWQRQYFSDVTQSILFSEQSLDRGYYSKEGLTEVFDGHVYKNQNHAHFLGTAVAIELWHRKFID